MTKAEHLILIAEATSSGGKSPLTRHTIAVVEDDARLADHLRVGLSEAGYEVFVASGEAELVSILLSECIGLVTLDINLDGVRSKGLDIAKSIRASRNTPIIAITALGEPLDRLRGLEVGIDDYVTKPFLMGEVLIRVERAFQLYRQPVRNAGNAASTTLHFSGYVLDLARRDLRSAEGIKVELTETEFGILSLLAGSPSRILSRQELWMSLRGVDWPPLDRTLDVHVARLRRKLEPGAERPELIKSVRGVGYVLTRAVTTHGV